MFSFFIDFQIITNVISSYKIFNNRMESCIILFNYMQSYIILNNRIQLCIYVYFLEQLYKSSSFPFYIGALQSN